MIYYCIYYLILLFGKSDSNFTTISVFSPLTPSGSKNISDPLMAD